MSAYICACVCVCVCVFVIIMNEYHLIKLVNSHSRKTQRYTVMDETEARFLDWCWRVLTQPTRITAKHRDTMCQQFQIAYWMKQNRFSKKRSNRFWGAHIYMSVYTRDDMYSARPDCTYACVYIHMGVCTYVLLLFTYRNRTTSPGSARIFWGVRMIV